MLKRLILEVHRRSLWQVLTIYAVGAWVALQVVGEVTESAGLPDWVPGLALVLLIIGLPIVLATAFVQEGMPGKDAPEHTPPGPAPAADEPSEGDTVPERPRRRGRYRLFTWRNALIGGVTAFALLGVAVAGYFVMRATGVGPAASLAAQGVLAEREPIVLAEFGNTTSDTTLGNLVTEALRIDLLESRAVTLVTPAYLAGALQRTGREPNARVTADVAREIAVRDGIKAVVQGDVRAAGGGYVLTASIVTPETGEALAAFRETAATEQDLLAAIDRLSSRIREKAGESLRSIRAGEPLSDVTTRSLDALRAYTTSVRYFDSGDREAAIRLLETAIELDPEFAMAYRKLSASLRAQGREPERARAAATRAYELRDRLPRVERLLAEAYYYGNVTQDLPSAADAYRELLATHPDHPVALNNLALLLVRTPAELSEGVELLKRALNGPGASISAHLNLAAHLWHLRRDGELEPVIAAAERRYPDNYQAMALRPVYTALQAQFDRAHELFVPILQRFSAQPRPHYEASMSLGFIDLGRGRLGEGRAHVQDAMRIAREEQEAAWLIDAGWNLATAELMTAKAPERARALIRDIEADMPIESADVGFGTAANLAAIAALVGDADLAARARQKFERLAPPERSPDYETMRAIMDWGQAVAGGDHAAALEQAREYERLNHDACDGRRCYGLMEQGMALEELGKTAEAIVAYEQQHITEPLAAGVFHPWLLERLAELHEQQGNAARAAEYYARFAELWRNADAELQPRVAHARERAAALRAAR